MAAIGVFDSGIGGLTVLKALLTELPQESFVYLGDTARLPYGSKSPRTIGHYLSQNVAFLNGFGVKAIVVACNSASTVLEGSHWDGLPIYGVIEPGARQACEVTHNRRVGVLGTRATVQSGAYVAAIHEIDPGITAIQQACPLLVPLVEEGWETDEVTTEIVQKYLHEPLAQGVDTLILGCTHYPVLKPIIQRFAGNAVHLVDSAEVVARQIKSDLEHGRIPPSEGPPFTRIWATDISPGFKEVGGRILAPFEGWDWDLANIRG